MAFDGIVCKGIATELNNLVGARVEKIYQPERNTVTLGLYSNGKNYTLNLCIDATYYRINLTNTRKPNPQQPPNFCMVLRKYITGLRLKQVYTIGLERVVFIEFEGFHETDGLFSLKLVVELMGKHSNMILLNSSDTIINSLRHIKEDDNSYRNILPHLKYVFPTTEKLDLYDVKDFEDFKLKLGQASIASTFNGISKNFVAYASKKTDGSLESIYKYIMHTLNNVEKLSLVVDESNYCVEVNQNKKGFELNYEIDNYYTAKETENNFKNYRNTILKIILNMLKKYNKRLINIDEKLKQCDNMDLYKLYGELITANLYRIKDQNANYVELENYYNNNELIKIPLDKRYSPSTNSKMYFKKYNKFKNTIDIVSKQKEATILELNYLESIVYELENCSTIEEVDYIYDEISENNIFKGKLPNLNTGKKIKVKKSQLTKNKTVKFNPIKYNVKGHTIFVGRNNKENDHLTLRFAKKSDIWFHTKDIHGSHVILKAIPNEKISDDILIKCAEIAAYHSKARSSSNVPVDYCEVRYVKKPSGSKPGMVIYTNNKTLNVNPKI